jgi:chromosome segregation ATPase
MESLFQSLLDQYGLAVALIALSIVNYVLMRRRTQKTDDQAQAAITAQQNALTAQFTAQSEDNRKLHAELQSVRAEQVAQHAQLDAARAARDDLAQDLAATKRTADAAQSAQKASDARAAELSKELDALRTKVQQLETERTARTEELKRETERATKLEREVTDLRGRVARLEGENNALHKVIDKLNVVSVKAPDPDPDPDTPPTARVRPTPEPDSEQESAA